ncbi:MAG: VCBS repeat-containing protein [Pirellulales bacterium]|nr:VCBS repeat-containing protein [Pirellulales bacterium]
MSASDVIRWRVFLLVSLASGTMIGAMAQPTAAEEGKSLAFSKRCLMVNPNEGCAVADINKDGRPDVVAGTHWYAGPDFMPRPIREIPEFGPTSSGMDYLATNGDHPHDVDGDGWIDVIAGGWMEPEIYWYRNPGEAALAKGNLWERRLLKSTHGANEAYVLKDFDGDGVPELFVNCWNQGDPQVVWRLAKTPEGEPTLERIEIGPKSGHGYGFGDVNGDGREDILIETGWYERPESDVLARAWKFHPETALPHPSCPFLAVDLTGDGRTDLIWGKAHDYGLYWWEQGPPKPDGTTTWTEHEIDREWSQAHCLVWADLDGDGECELITGKRVRAHAGGDPGGNEPAVLYYYTWDKAARKFARHTIGAPGEGIGTGMQIVVADLNADARPDIVVAGKSGTWVLLNEGVRPAE